jgi:cellobiose phosphorylase
MQYGHFSPDGREFIVTRPDTPKPWYNYLFNDLYHCLISQTGGGFSYYRDPKYYRIQRYDHLSTDRPGRYIYLREGGKLWSLNWQPMRKPLSKWECRQGLGYTTITAEAHGIESTATYFVAKEAPLELWLVSLKNTAKAKKSVEAFPFVEFVAGDVALETHYRNILMLYNEASYDPAVKAIVAFKHPFKTWHKTGYAFFSASFPIESTECRRDSFIGRYGSEADPVGLKRKRLSKQPVRGEDMVGVLQGTFQLKPGESREFVVLLGLTDKRQDLAGLVKKFRSLEAAKEELSKVKAHWRKALEEIWIETPDKNLDRMINLWGKYQLFAITHWRGTSHYHGAEGGQGYRDTCQDVEGLLSVDLTTARAKLERLLFYQYKSGHAVSGFSEIEGTWENQGVAGVIKKADVAVWLPYSVVSYIKETGDTAFLKKQIPFHDGDAASVYEHVLRALRYLYGARGQHGLPLIGHADWNDAYDHVGIKGKGESIWLGMAFVRACRQVEELALFIGDKVVEQEMRAKGDELSRIVNQEGWEESPPKGAGGQGWYLAAFNDLGCKIGSKENEEGKVPLNSQTWAILSGVVTPERLPKILEKIDRTLDTPYGPALFLPSYTSFNHGIGRVTAFAAGTKENGAVFSHACAFKVVADCTIKRGDQAYDTFSKLLPVSKAKRDHDRYKVEPYVWAEYVIGPGSADRFGEGAFTWNTGTTPWMFCAATEWILGVRREFGGLLIDPCLPRHWKEAAIRRPFRGAVYQVTIHNPEGVCSGVKRITVDGVEQKSPLIKPHADGKTHRVEVFLGRSGSAPKGARRKVVVKSDKI